MKFLKNKFCPVGSRLVTDRIKSENIGLKKKEQAQALTFSDFPGKIADFCKINTLK